MLGSMATFVLIHGAGSDSSYWNLVAPGLRTAGHDVVAVDLPCDDDSAGLAAYADVVIEAIGDRRDLVLVASSMGGFTAPLVCARLPVDLLILVAAMVPSPGESGNEWWVNTRHAEAMRKQARREGRDPDDDDPDVLFLHDVSAEQLEASGSVVKDQSPTPFDAPWPLDAWPDVPTRFLLGRNDRFFPADFLRRVVEERLGITPDEMDSGHLPALAQPEELTARLLAYVTFDL
jgi:pimeloyl-ACP methyl ester carboxylesterase